MLIVDAQIHLWEKGTPSAHHRQQPYSAEEAIAGMDGPKYAICAGLWITQYIKIGNLNRCCADPVVRHASSALSLTIAA